MVRQAMCWLLALVCWCGSLSVYAQGPKKLWRLYTDANKTLTLYYSETAPATIGGQAVTESQEYTGNNRATAMMLANTTVAVVDATVASGYAPTHLVNLFSKLEKLERIEGQTNLMPLIATATDISHMFQNCKKLEAIDVAGWNTAKVTNMQSLFANCDKLTTLTIDGWDVSKVTNMQSLFHHCQSLTSLNLSNWNTEAVTTMYRMFFGCESLKTANVAGWNTANVTTMQDMFRACHKLEALDFTGWNTAKVQNMAGMFRDCRSLISLDMLGLSGTALANLDALKEMFLRTYSLQYVDWRNTTDFTAEQLQKLHADSKVPVTLYYTPIGMIHGISTNQVNFVTTPDGTLYSCNQFYLADEYKMLALAPNRPNYYRPQYVVNIPQAFTAMTVKDTRFVPSVTTVGEAYTWFAPYDAPIPANVKVYEFVSNTVNGTQATFQLATDIRLQAQKPYLIVLTSGELSGEIATSCDVKAYTPGTDVVVTGNGWDFVGTFKIRTAAEAAVEGFYALQPGNKWNTYAGSTAIPSPLRAYLKNKGTSGASTLSLVLNDGITSINTAASATAPSTAPIYDLSGRYVGQDQTKLSKGVYIVGGRKVTIQ